MVSKLDLESASPGLIPSGHVTDFFFLFSLFFLEANKLFCFFLFISKLNDISEIRKVIAYHNELHDVTIYLYFR